METWQTQLSPAPWQGDHGEIYDANNNVVVFMAVDGERFNHANELLIASAPELLDACKYLLENAEAQGWSEFMLADARAAIAQAEGRTNEE